VARIRTVKPEFFTSDDVCALSPLARLLFIGCWCEADREGRLEWRPRTLKRKYLPEDDCDAEEICQSLVASGLIILYGQGLAYVTGFSKHQVINLREAQSKLPEPPAVTCNAHALPAIAPGKGKEGKGREGDSVAKATGGQVPPKDVIFSEGLAWLKKHSGLEEVAVRKILGRWCKDYGDEAVMAALAMAEASKPVDPVSWIIGKFTPRESYEQKRQRENLAVIHGYEAEHDRH